MSEHFTSDKQERRNTLAQFAVTVTIPTSISDSARIGVLADIGAAITGAGGALTVIDRSAAYDQNTITQRINDISTEVNTLGATPALPIFTSTDYNSFTSIMTNIVAAMAALPASGEEARG